MSQWFVCGMLDIFRRGILGSLLRVEHRQFVSVVLISRQIGRIDIYNSDLDLLTNSRLLTPDQSALLKIRNLTNINKNPCF